jgi:tetratricopeptide (TPR) repeat protein
MTVVTQGSRNKSITSTPAPTHTIAPPTPTFDAAVVVTRTPQRPSICPIQMPGLRPDFSRDLKYDRYYRLKQTVLGFLSSGGTFEKLIEPITLYSYVWDREITFIAEAFREDLTGDGVPEIIMRDEVDFYVLGCQAGEYQTLWTIEGRVAGPIGTGAARMVDIEDINLDGIQEILISESSCGNCVDDNYHLLEWDGTAFTSLFEQQRYRSPYGAMIQDFHLPGVISIKGLSNDDPAVHPTILQDIDHNGIFKLVFSGGIPTSGIARNGGPWRVETITLSWNGSSYIVTDWEADAPKFRFQADQDGDVYTSFHNYDKALESYQQAIFNDALDSWSSTRQEYEQRYFFDPYYDGIVPAEPAPDLVESANLVAYARFKIMLLHAIQGHLPEAQIVYETLLSKFPIGTEGSIYAELARLFWEEYQASQNTGAACSVVAQKVARDPYPYLRYLGNGAADAEHPNADIFGAWSLTYTPEDICPFEP